MPATASPAVITEIGRQEQQEDAASDHGSRQRLRPFDLPEWIDLIKRADIPERNSRSSALRHVAPLGNAKHLTGVDTIWIAEHGLIGVEDGHVSVGMAVDLAHDLGQAVAGLDRVEAGGRMNRVAHGQRR
jgi:hypothetical protein